jgi:cytochrome c oxidase assembly protein subunit 15
MWHKNNNLRLLSRWALFATAIACVVVILGAFTRLSDAGLGCPDWPGCYGHLTWPKSEGAVAAAEARFPEFPVEHDKTWPEMVHRYFAGFLGLIILTMTVATWRWAAKAPHQHYPRFHILGLLGLVILQGLFGMWTVTLKLWPQIVTAHLLGGFATLGLLWLFTQRCSGAHWQLPEHLLRRLFGLKFLILLTLLAVIVQIALGGWTSSNYAALACTDLPTCHGQWWPDMDFIHAFNFSQDIGPNYLGGLLENEARTAIHVSHRLGAIAVSLLVLLLWWKLVSFGTVITRPIAWLLLMVLFGQLALGITNVLGSLPLSVAVAHNAVGALLLLVILTLTHRVFTARSC